MAEDIVGGPGWVIRATDLRPAITDADAFAKDRQSDPLGGILTLLWSGDAAAALHLLEQEPATHRVRALRADCRRDLGHFTLALLEYDILVDEAMHTSREAVIRQHRGKARLAAGDTNRALDDFGRAVFLRQDGDPGLLASAQQALQVAEARRVSEAEASNQTQCFKATEAVTVHNE